MYDEFRKFVNENKKICVIQAENPDGDSLGSAGALEEILADNEVSLYCPVDIPKYLRYLEVWSRVAKDFDYSADAYIIVDAAAEVLLSKTLKDQAAREALETKPVMVIDHHETEPDFQFEYLAILDKRPSATELIYEVSKGAEFTINAEAAQNLLAGLMSDTLGLTIESVTSGDYRLAAELLDLGANIAALEESRREYMKKSPRILDYKADLIKRIEYHLDGKLATTLIPWEDIREYSDEYNPNVLILEEMRLVEGVEVAMAIKTYPDGKLTGKIRTSKPIAEEIAGYFGGGGHKYASGFRVYDTYEKVLPEIVSLVDDLTRG
jgi:phosphoesterase RecJ-like protein